MLFTPFTHFFLPGKPLPFEWAFGSSVQLGSSFALVGGQNSTGLLLDVALVYDAENGSWNEVADRLSVAKKHSVAIPVVKESFPKCFQ